MITLSDFQVRKSSLEKAAAQAAGAVTHIAMPEVSRQLPPEALAKLLASFGVVAFHLPEETAAAQRGEVRLRTCSLLAQDGVHDPTSSDMRLCASAVRKDVSLVAPRLFKCMAKPSKVEVRTRRSPISVGGLRNGPYRWRVTDGVNGRRVERVVEDVTEQPHLVFGLRIWVLRSLLSPSRCVIRLKLLYRAESDPQCLTR
jgi:hypothetical protein